MEAKVQQWIASLIDRACHYQSSVHAISERPGIKMVRLPSDPGSPDIEKPDPKSFILNHAQMAYYRRDSPVVKAWQSGEVAWSGVV